MLKFEAIRINPSPGEITEVLSDATVAANKRCRTRLLADDPAKWRKFARQVMTGPEGFELWRGGRGGAPGTQLVGSWWTDHIGCKHVVVRGRRIEHESAKLLLYKDELARRPPLWHCYPQYLYERWLPVVNDLPARDGIAVCGCGATGTPEALGWMGETCGPCHDRREDGGSLAENRPGWMHGTRHPFDSLAFSRSGNYLAGIEIDGALSVWNLASGEVVRIATSERPVQESEVVFAGANDEYVMVNILNGSSGGVRIYRWQMPEAEPVLVHHEEIGEFHIWPSSSPDHALVQSSSVVLVTMPHGRYTPTHHQPRQYFRMPPASEPSPAILPLVCTNGIRLVDTRTLEVLESIPYRSERQLMYHRVGVAVHRQKNLVYVARTTVLDVYDRTEKNYLKSIAVNRIPIAGYLNMPAWANRIALTVDGRYLLLAIEERLLVLDAHTQLPLAAFAWHLGPIRCLAISPDGTTLATAGNDGSAKLWPIDQLIACCSA